MRFFGESYAEDCIYLDRRGKAGCVAPDDILEAAEARLLVGPPSLCIVVGNPQLALVYQHQVEAWTFRFGTRKVREVLGDEVPLSDLEIFASIRGALTEELATFGSETATGG